MESFRLGSPLLVARDKLPGKGGGIGGDIFEIPSGGGGGGTPLIGADEVRW